MEHVQRPQGHTLAYRRTLTKARFCAHKEVSAHGRGRVWADTLHSDCSLRFNKKCLGEDAQEFRMLIRRSASRQRSIPVSFQNGVHEIIVFLLQFLS